MLKTIKTQIVEEKGIYRALLIPCVIVLGIMVLSLAANIGVALAMSVGVFLMFAVAINFLIPGALKIIAFSAGAGWLESAIGIWFTLLLLVARRLATFFWWSKWFWAMLIVPFAVYYGLCTSASGFVAWWNAPFDVSGYFSSNIINMGGTSGYSTTNTFIVLGMVLAIGSVGYCAFYYCGKALKYLIEN